VRDPVRALLTTVLALGGAESVAVGGPVPGLTAPAKTATERPAAVEPVGAATQPAARGPKYVCDAPVYEFKPVWTGAAIDHTFLVRNEGDEDLVILEAKATCHCTVLPNYDRAIKPGGTGRFPATLRSEGQRDHVVKELIIVTNERGENTHKLVMKGFIHTVVNILPLGATYFPPLTPNGRVTKEITLKNTSGVSPLTLELQPVTQAQPYTATLTETVPGEEFLLVVTAEPPFRDNQNPGTFLFKTNVPEQPIYKLDVHGFLPPRVQLMPPMFLVDGNQQADQFRPLSVRNNGDTPFTVQSVTSSVPEIEPRFVERIGNEFRYQVRIPAHYRPPPAGEHLIFETDDAEQPQIRFDIRASGPPPPTAVTHAARRGAPTTRPATTRPVRQPPIRIPLRPRTTRPAAP